MTTQTHTIGTFTSIPFTTTSLSTLANVTYVTSTSAVDLGTPTPNDAFLQLSVTPNGTVTGNKQAILFIQVSLDGTNYSSGPTSGTTITDQSDLYFIGALPLNTNSGAQRKTFSIFGALDWCPRYFKPVIFNDCGVAFSAGVLDYSTDVGTST